MKILQHTQKRKSAVKSWVQILASLILSCGSACLSVLVLVRLIMSPCYFALASQVSERLEAKLNYKPTEQFLSLARRHTHLKYLGNISDYCLLSSSFLQHELSGHWQRVLFILAPQKPCMGSALHNWVARLSSIIMWVSKTCLYSIGQESLSLKFILSSVLVVQWKRSTFWNPNIYFQFFVCW